MVTKRRVQAALLEIVLMGASAMVSAAVGTADEMAQSRRWVAAKLGGDGAAPPAPPGLYVLANNDPVQLNSRNGGPMQLGDTPYTHGLYCHAVSKVVVRLPQPGRTFTATVGVDLNENTRGGGGSVVFTVSIGGKPAFDSGLLRPTTPAQAVHLDLAGATEFTLDVGDGGDGISCDQADWADAKVVLADGSSLGLADLPLRAPAGQAFGPEPLFSFVYGGTPFAELSRTWKVERAARRLDDQRTEHTLIYSDPRTGLVARCSGIEYADFPAVEWVVNLENTGPADTPILEDIQALDAVLPLPSIGPSALHWSTGGVASFEDFAPRTTTLALESSQRLAADEGRSSSKVLPFFNLESAGGGVVVALGWSGNWIADFANRANGLALRAGMAKTHLILRPGESIRTPRMLLLAYNGDRWRGQNLLRRFILTHRRPQVDGKPQVAPITWGNWGGTSAEVHLDNIRQIVAQQLPIDYYWIDAGWYGRDGIAGQWATEVGNWTIGKNLYPNGFQPLARALRDSGRRLMLWFEPERVRKDSEWYRTHHDWLIDIQQDDCLFDLGNPAARQFLIDVISARIDEFGLGCYRQDFNMDPRPFWQAADAPDRQGMSEIRHIAGLYAFWDGLLARHPDLWIDNCASGGRRIDLETVGRATPFWRTDGPRDAVAHQCHTFGLMAWVPLSATSQDREGDDYEFRSSISSGLCVNWWHSGDGPQKPFYPDFPFAWGKRVLDQYLTLRHLYYGDYYPLTAWSLEQTQWLGWQFDVPEDGTGMVQVFRRQDSPYESIRLRLRGLDANATYVLTNLDVPGTTSTSGRELLEQGLAIALAARPGAAIITYRKQP
jgi:alpha-galactosidase